jgi:hypothetical protein
MLALSGNAWVLGLSTVILGIFTPGIVPLALGGYGYSYLFSHSHNNYTLIFACGAVALALAFLADIVASRIRTAPATGR